MNRKQYNVKIDKLKIANPKFASNIDEVTELFWGAYDSNNFLYVMNLILPLANPIDAYVLGMMTGEMVSKQRLYEEMMCICGHQKKFHNGIDGYCYQCKCKKFEEI